MSTTKKPAKSPEELQAALQKLIAQGRKEGMVRTSDLNAILEKMDMTPEKIERINALARKSKTPEDLTALERAEQQRLRKEYIEDFRRSPREILDNTYLQRPDGTKEKLKPKQ